MLRYWLGCLISAVTVFAENANQDDILLNFRRSDPYDYRLLNENFEYKSTQGALGGISVVANDIKYWDGKDTPSTCGNLAAMLKAKEVPTQLKTRVALYANRDEAQLASPFHNTWIGVLRYDENDINAYFRTEIQDVEGRFAAKLGWDDLNRFEPLPTILSNALDSMAHLEVYRIAFKLVDSTDRKLEMGSITIETYNRTTPAGPKGIINDKLPILHPFWPDNVPHPPPTTSGTLAVGSMYRREITTFTVDILVSAINHKAASAGCGYIGLEPTDDTTSLVNLLLEGFRRNERFQVENPPPDRKKWKIVQEYTGDIRFTLKADFGLPYARIVSDNPKALSLLVNDMLDELRANKWAAVRAMLIDGQFCLPVGILSLSIKR